MFLWDQWVDFFGCGFNCFRVFKLVKWIDSRVLYVFVGIKCECCNKQKFDCFFYWFVIFFSFLLS